MDAKRRAAEAAVPFLRDGMAVGLGTGSTADQFLQALAAALADGRVKGIVGVPTSRVSEARATELGIPLTTLEAHPHLDLTVDGADEFDPNLDLIKGLGGALVREKIVAQNSRQFVIIADASKRVPHLGSRSPLPVEVVPFAHEVQEPFFRSLGADPILRQVDGAVFKTDNGNLIYDLRFADPIDVPRVERALLDRAGIVGCGLFVGMADVVLVADGDRVERLDRTNPQRPPPRAV